MDNNITKPKEKKQGKKARRVIHFFTDWAQEAQDMGVVCLNQSLEILKESFLASVMADDRSTRIRVMGAIAHLEALTEYLEDNEKVLDILYLYEQHKQIGNGGSTLQE